MEFLPEVEIPAETDEEVSGATRHITDLASQYIPEVAITQEITTSASITTSTLPPIPPRNPQPHSNDIAILVRVEASKMNANHVVSQDNISVLSASCTEGVNMSII